MKNQISNAVARIKENKNELIGAIIIFAVYLLMIYFPAFRPVGMDRDSAHYAEYVNEFVSSGFTHTRGGVEFTFYIIARIASFLFKDPVRGVLVIYAFLSITIKMAAIIKYSDDKLMSIFVYLGFLYIVQDFNTIRSSVATGIFLLAYDFIRRRKFLPYLLMIIVAALFHNSCIILIPLYFVNKKWFRNIMYPMIALGIIIDLTGLNMAFIKLFEQKGPSFIASRITAYFGMMSAGVLAKNSIQRQIYNAGMVLIMIVCDVFFERKDEELNMQKSIIKAGIAFYYFTAAMPVIAGRMSEVISVYLVLLIPKLLHTLKKGQAEVFGSIIFMFCLGLLVMYARTDLNLSVVF